jgi:hypothetical protein
LESYGLQARRVDVVGLLGLENLQGQGVLLVMLLDITGKMVGRYACMVFVMLDVREALIGSVISLSIALDPAMLTHSHSAQRLHIQLLKILRPIMCGLAVGIINLFLRSRQVYLFFYFLLDDSRLLVFVNHLVYSGKCLLFLFNFL